MQLFGGELSWWQGEPPWDKVGRVTRRWPEARGWCSCGPTCEQGWQPLRYPFPTPNFSQANENGGRQRALRKDRESGWLVGQQPTYFPKLPPKRRVNLIILSAVLLDCSPHLLSLYVFSSLPLWCFFHKHLICYPAITIVWPWTFDLNLSFWIWKMETITSCSFERIKWVDSCRLTVNMRRDDVYCNKHSPPSRYFCLWAGLPASDLGRCHVTLIFCHPTVH